MVLPYTYRTVARVEPAFNREVFTPQVYADFIARCPGGLSREGDLAADDLKPCRGGSQEIF
jgi:hypothetical protein